MDASRAYPSMRLESQRFATAPTLCVRRVLALIAVQLIIFAPDVVRGQNYPNRPLRIVTAEPGGGSDLTARLIAQGLSAAFDQPVIVDNRPAGIIPAEIVSKATPDGYTLLVTGGTFWVGPLMQRTPYDPVRDFSPITLAASSPNVVAVNPSVAARSVTELIALAKSKPGELNYASGPAGSTNHLAAELFKSMAGVNIVRISYKSTGQAVNDLIGGRVQLMFVSLAGAIQQVKAGKLRALAVTSAEPTALFPGLPTVAASGLPGYQNVNTSSMFAPANTSAASIARISQETVRVLTRPEIKEKFFNAGSEIVASSPAELAKTMKSEMSIMGKLIKSAGIRSE